MSNGTWVNTALTVTGGGGGGGNGGYYTFISPDTNFTVKLVGGNELFQHHAPKSKGIKAVKATRSNMDDLAKRIGKSVDQAVVETDDTVYESGETEHGSKRLWVYSNEMWGINEGDWVVEEYDYEQGRTTYRLATLAERKKHDLR